MIAPQDDAPGCASPPPLPPFTIRPARMGDREALARLLTASYSQLLVDDYTPELLREAVPLITRPRAALLNAGSYYLADCGNGLLAAGGWTFHPPGRGATGPGEVGHIRQVATAPDRAGKGVGRVLMEHALFRAQASGVRRMLCFSTLTAQGFYAKLGFVAQGEITLTLAPGLDFPAVQMCLEM